MYIGSIEKDFDMVEDYITEMIENNMTPNFCLQYIKYICMHNNHVAVNSIYGANGCKQCTQNAINVQHFNQCLCTFTRFR